VFTELLHADRLKREEQTDRLKALPPLVKLSFLQRAGLTLPAAANPFVLTHAGGPGEGHRPGKAHRFFVRFNFAARPGLGWPAACASHSSAGRPGHLAAAATAPPPPPPPPCGLSITSLPALPPPCCRLAGLT